MAAKAKTPPVILAGPATAVRGRITLANTGGERLVIRGGLLHLPKSGPIPVQLTALVAPGITAQAVVAVDLGSAWPAGTLPGELEVNGQRRDVEVRVVQTVGVDISPSDALVTAGVTSLSVVVRNTGNVAVPLARLSRGRLVAHDSGDPHISGDPHVSGDPHESPDATLRLPASITVQPGDEVPLQIEVEIPKGLAADRRHRARLPIGPSDLVVMVLPVDPPRLSADKAAPARKATASPKPTPTRKSTPTRKPRKRPTTTKES